MFDWEVLDTVSTEVWVGEPRQLDAFEESPYGAREGIFYSYRWGDRELMRGTAVDAVSIVPAVLVAPQLDPGFPEGGMMQFASMQEAKLYCWENGGGQQTRIVIALRIKDKAQSLLIKLECADYPGYLNTLSYASELTGVSFDDMAAPRGVELVNEEPTSIKYKIRELRKARKQGNELRAELLAQQIRVDFNHRHARNVTD